MINIPVEVEAQFLAAGWALGRRNTYYVSNPAFSNIYAHAVFQQFGGLNVGRCGSGQQMATSNIHFLATPVSAKSAAVSRWQHKSGKLTAIADAHHDHMILYVSETGEYYCFTDPDDKLYLVGANFGEAMCNLLLGHSLGLEVEPDKADAI